MFLMHSSFAKKKIPRGQEILEESREVTECCMCWSLEAWALVLTFMTRNRIQNRRSVHVQNQIKDSHIKQGF